ncbi:DEAD/DEAH box helicase [Mesorhizobium sp.]|uniref:DEAD/DEAH box helicase n=4 Tax=unclassified Mesorhizobium TaxID=325217 RepID=UPI0025847C00|nr:DEAD/DEAH box helicase [Mesorhizobium sp.]
MDRETSNAGKAEQCELATGGEADTPPAAAVAAALISALESTRNGNMLHIASSERSAADITQALRHFLPEADILYLPPWDCLPYDRVWPTRATMGRRVSVVHAVAAATKRPRITVTSVESALQRVPPPSAIGQGFATLQIGQEVDPRALRVLAERTGYVVDDRVDEPGEMAVRGDLIDIFPADRDRPIRVVLGPGGTISELKAYDQITQRSERSLHRVVVGPASELMLESGNEFDPAAMRTIPMEERLVSHYSDLPALFDVASTANICFLDGLEEISLARVLDLIEEAWRGRRQVSTVARPAAKQFYLSREEWDDSLRDRQCLRLRIPVGRIPKFFHLPRAGHEFAEFAQARTSSGFSVVVTGEASELRRAERLLDRKFGRKMDPVADWPQILSVERGSLLKAEFDLTDGFVDGPSRIAVVAAADIFGPSSTANADSGNGIAEPELRLGDLVVHEDHGVGVLAAIEQIEVAGLQQDVVKLEYHGGASLLVPVEEFGRIWRYGSEPDAIALDRLDGEGWKKRRQSAVREIEKVAKRLVAIAKARSSQSAELIKPPRADLARFAARFPYPATPDQAAAIRAVMDDLSSGKTMNRLVCGDVGFGKTEVALRACAAAAFCGKQVAIVAPTTVLARQHYETFCRRFAGFNIQVAHLSRVVGSTETRKVKDGLRSGNIAVVVGTHAVAAKRVAFSDLGLLVIDEEHRFGAKLKQSLRGLARCLHTLTMSATPIPRTLQSAMAGVQEVSVLNTPPAKRRPVRTILAPFDAGSAKAALLREYRRGGQSFFVVPRIDDIETVVEQLGRLVPQLSVKIAHGEMKGRELDEIVVRFAAGEGDILLATDIIESGLDIPRANTILVWRADRFGLAQLHQLRGRVGRGRIQGIALLLTEPGKELAEATRSRLSALVALDRLGSGLAISQRDLDLRGAGDLFGEEQAGHVKLIGVGLYHRLLERASSIARGGPRSDMQLPDINLQAGGSFPESYVREPAIRLSLYSRLFRISTHLDVNAFADEVEDRFGAMPSEAATLLEVSRLRIDAAELGLSQVDVGPEAIAITFRTKVSASVRQNILRLDGFEFRRGRLICRPSNKPGIAKLEVLRSVIGSIRSAHSARELNARPITGQSTTGNGP